MKLRFTFEKMARIIQRNWFFSICIAVLLLSFWLRWSGVYWQLPDTRMSDEQVVMSMTHDISLHHDFLRIKKPDGFWYCPAYNYLSLIVYKIFDRFAVGVGLFPSQPLIPLWTHFLICRILSIFMSLGTIAVLILMFKNVFGKLTASLAGLFFALNGIEIYRAVIAHSDTMVVFLSTLTLYLAFKIINTKGWALYLVAGAIYGAAVSSRLFALGFFFPLVAGHILAQKGDNLVSRMLNALRDLRWLILPFAALGGFVITNPQSLLAVGQFLKAVQVELISEWLGSSMGPFKLTAELLSRMKFVYSNLLATTFSPSLVYSKIHAPISILKLLPLALALVGLIILLIRRFKLGLMMLVAFISANLFIIPVTQSSPYTHHYLVVVPICALLIGSALDPLWRYVIRTKLAYFRLLLCGIIIGAIAFVAIEMLNEATQIHNFKSGKGSFSRRTDYRKWMIDHIPPGSRIAYDRYGTDLIPGYFDVVKKPGFDKGLDYYSKNFDYVIMSWDRIYQYKVFQELLKYKPMALFEPEEVYSMPRLAIYKMDRDESNHDRMRNFYTETLPRKNGIETTINDPSFENGELLESWGVRLSHHPYRAWKRIYEYWAWDEIYRPDGKPIKWWDGENNPPHSLIERVSDIRSDGKFSLHIMLDEEEPKGNLLSKGDSTFETEGQWIWHGNHSASREADGNSYEGKYALKAVSSGPYREWNGIFLTAAFFNYNSDQPNKMTFYAKSASGTRTLRVRSGDGTWATFALSDYYQTYEIIGDIRCHRKPLLPRRPGQLFFRL